MALRGNGLRGRDTRLAPRHSRARDYKYPVFLAAPLLATVAASPEITAEVRRHAPRDQG